VIITEERIAELLEQLDAAGGDWAATARGFAERNKIRPGRWQGLAWVRPAVFVAAECERFPMVPVCLLLHEDGTWFHKGTRQGRL
jgi:hypothetical protein